MSSKSVLRAKVFLNKSKKYNLKVSKKISHRKKMGMNKHNLFFINTNPMLRPKVLWLHFYDVTQSVEILVEKKIILEEKAVALQILD